MKGEMNELKTRLQQVLRERDLLERQVNMTQVTQGEGERDRGGGKGGGGGREREREMFVCWLVA